MSAILKLFGATELPEFDFVNPATGSGPTASTATKIGSGAFFDALGTDRAPLDLPYEVAFRGTIAEATTALFAARMKRLRGLRGKVNHLVRELEDGTVHWCEAKCLQARADGEAGQALVQEFDLVFEIRSPWYGARHGDAAYLGQSGVYLGDGTVLGYAEVHTLDASPKSIVLSNAGEGQVRGVRITVTAGDAPITALRLACSGTDCEWDFTGSIAATKSLVVDCGAWTVRNDGTDAWNNLQTTANHQRGEWLLLQPGDNTVTVTFTTAGSDPTVRFDFSDVHE